MVKFLKELGDFLNSLPIEGKTYGKIPPSRNSLRPGDIVFFSYESFSNKARAVLIVSNRSGQGVFISTRGNKLASGFVLEGSPAVINEIIAALYKNRRKASYQNIISSLGALLGKQNYRTFKLSKMINLHTLNFKK